MIASAAASSWAIPPKVMGAAAAPVRFPGRPALSQRNAATAARLKLLSTSWQEASWVVGISRCRSRLEIVIAASRATTRHRCGGRPLLSLGQAATRRQAKIADPAPVVSGVREPGRGHCPRAAGSCAAGRRGRVVGGPSGRSTDRSPALAPARGNRGHRRPSHRREAVGVQPASARGRSGPSAAAPAPGAACARERHLPARRDAPGLGGWESQ